MSKKLRSILYFFSLGILLFGQFQLVRAEESPAPPPTSDEFYRGKVEDVLGESYEDKYGIPTIIQDLRVKLLNGPEKGKTIYIVNEIEQGKDQRKIAAGQQIVVGKNISPVDTIYYISDVYRLQSLWFIVALFFFITILFAGWYGLRSFIGLIISFAVIIWFIIPHIVAGRSPVLVSLIGILFIACTSLYIAHGFHKRTNIAFVSTLLTSFFALGFGSLFIRLAHLFGLGSEEAFFLQFSPIESIDLRGLLLGGIIIGTLGVLDDITTAQAAAVEQIHEANEKFDVFELYKRGSAVGREHIVSLVNTLVLAYTGASLPLLLLFHIYKQPIWVTLNSEIIVEEVIRMLVGSITLIFAVPITTFLAAYFFSKKK